MKKMAIILGMICCMVVFHGCGNKESYQPTADEVTFKEEYEALNGKETSSGTYVSVNIPNQNKMVYASFEQIMELLEQGTGVIYFGFPECPWCRNAVPVLIDAVKELGIDSIYYFNARDMRDQKTLNEQGEIITEKEGTPEYQQLLAALGSFADPYDGLNNQEVKRLYFPTVVVVKDGKIIGTHTSTVDSQKDPSIVLKEDQKNELKELYQTYLTKIKKSVCDEAC